MDRVDLPVESVELTLKELIEYGDYGLLSREVLRQWSVRAVWTAAPSDAEVQRLLNLRAGGLNYSGRENPFLISFVREYLNQGPDHLALFEDAVAREGDPVLSKSRTPYAIIEGKVFPFLVGGDHESNVVEDAFLEAYSWRLVGILTRATARARGHELGACLEDLVACSQCVLVGAWDGEGVVVIDR